MKKIVNAVHARAKVAKLEAVAADAAVELTNVDVGLMNAARIQIVAVGNAVAADMIMLKC